MGYKTTHTLCLMQGAVADAHAAEAAAKDVSADAQRQLQRVAERDAQHAEVTLPQAHHETRINHHPQL